jgi:hypothetical protein
MISFRNPLGTKEVRLVACELRSIAAHKAASRRFNTSNTDMSNRLNTDINYADLDELGRAKS